MSTFPKGSTDGTNGRISRILNDDTRRLIPQFLLQQDQPVSVESIAQWLASIRSDGSNELLSADEEKKIKIGLHHTHLPKLAENDLVIYDERAGTVAITDHPLYTDLRAENRLPGHEGEAATMATLENPLRREALRIVNAVRSPISRDELARKIASREVDGESAEAGIPEVSAKLHHVHLPKLEESGLVTYDHDEGTITSQRASVHKHQQ